MKPRVTAIITGAGSGIGRGIALALARRGAELWLLGRRIAPLKETQELAGTGQVDTLDVGDEEGGRKFAAKLVSSPIRPQWLIHAAGVMPVGDFLGAERIEKTIRTNLLGPLALTFAVLGQAPGCRPVFLLSDTVFCPLAGVALYSASKAALHSFVRQQRAWAPVEVFPPVTRTAMTDEVNSPWMRKFLTCPLKVGEQIVAGMLQGRRVLNLSLASRNGVSRAVYRKFIGSGVRWIK